MKKKKLREQARDKYRNLPEVDKIKKRKYGRNRYYNICEENKQRLKEYQKNYRGTKKINIKMFHFFSFLCIKNEQEPVYFGENSIIKSAFHKNKRPIYINEVDIKKIVLSHKNSYGKNSFKYFIRYRHEGNAFLSPLCVKLPQINACAKYFDKKSIHMNTLVNDKEILKNI